MPDVEARISLVTTGGDSAAAEIKKGSDAINNITSSSSGMQSQFQHSFQHIGLKLFAVDALRSIGLSGEARMAINMMNMALTGAEEAAGISSGGLTLLVTALVAVGAAVYKVIEHHKSLVAELTATHDATEKSIKDTDDTIKSLKDYIAAGGLATKAQHDWLSATETLRTALINQQKLTDADTISTLKNVIAKEQAANKTLSWVQSLELLGAAMLKNIGLSSASDSIIKHVVGSIEAQNIALDKNKVALEKTIAELERLKSGNTKTFDQMTTEANNYWEAVSKGEKLQYDMITKLHKDIAEDHKKQLEIQTQNAKRAADTMARDFSTMATDMLLHAKSFSEAFTQLFDSMIEQAIQQVIKLIMEWTILQAISFGGAGAGGGMMGGIFGHALGGSVFADRPTLALFGEGGPEVATFTPMAGGGSGSGGGGGGGGSGDAYFGDINVTIQGVNNTDLIAKEIGQKIIQQIRGQGQINFTR